MSATKRFKHVALDDLHVQALEMKYDSDLSMIILLPNSRTGLAELENKLLNHNLIDNIVDRMQEKLVKVAIPKLKIQYKVELNDVLKKVCLFSSDYRMPLLIKNQFQFSWESQTFSTKAKQI